MKKYYLLFVAMIAMFVVSCEKSEPSVDDGNTDKAANSILILHEGAMGQNNSSLAMYNIENERLTDDYFSKINKRGLGDTASDMIKYGSKIYVSVSKSNTVEIIDINTGKSTKIENISQEPNKMVAHKGKVYVTSYDDTVTRIDTTSLTKEASIKVGRDPEGLCVWDDKLYVANSGALDFENNNHDETISVINIESFEEIEKISVGKNPYQLYPDSKGNIYFSTRAIYDANFELVSPSSLKVLDTKTKEIKTIDGIVPSKFVLANNIAYIIIEDYSKAIVTTYDCMSNKVIKDNIIPVDFNISTPYYISIDVESNNLYLTETDYSTPGNVHAFDKDGKHKYSVKATGINPTLVIEY